VDGGGNVDSVLQYLSRAGVDHRLSGRSIAGNPRDEYNLASLALSTSQLVFDIVDGVSWSGIALDITSIFELGAEDFIVWVGGNLLDDDVLAVVGDLVDDELGLSTTHAKVVEYSDALIVDRNS